MQIMEDQTGGLTREEASRLLSQVGPNDPVSARRTTIVLQILLFFANPLVIILLIASILSFVVGEIVNASIIAVMVILSVVINFIQTYHSQRVAENLRQQTAPTATALRDGKWIEVRRREIVPGDTIHLSAGDLVPADARLLRARDLHVNEAALTGESLPVEKGTGPANLANEYPDDKQNKVFFGTSIVSGTATATVTATGQNTDFGDIVARLATRPPETEFERGTRRFGFLIMRTIVFLVLFVVLVNIVLHRDPFQSLLFALALAVGLTPEFLPMITTVTLGKGAIHMARQKVIVKHLESIQNFGSMDILCSDKTGTLTSGVTTLERHIDPLGKESEEVLLYGYVNSYYETGIKNPLDAAIIQHSQIDVHQYVKLDEIPFDFERRRLSIVVDRGGEHLLITKGAPESLFACCSGYRKEDNVLALDSTTVEEARSTYRGLCANGYRVLAVAYKNLLQQESYTTADEHDLVLAGFLAFSDPPIDDAAEILKSLRHDGVEVKILTGDSDLVARRVCLSVGLDPGRVILGDEISKMTDPALAHMAEQHKVFARVSPAQKHRIIIALKTRGHVVGFLGDGINDSPSLHAADVGISVSNAVDIARDAADIILLEHSLKVLHQGIIEGRKAFGNVMKYLLMGTSSNFGNMFSMAAATVFLPFLPMLPTQILLNNFLYDLAQITIPTDNVDGSYIHKPRRWDIKLIRNFMVAIGPISSVFDFLTFFVLLKFFGASESFFHTGWFMESLATQVLIIFVIRTAGNPFKSRPGFALAATAITIVAIGVALPFLPFAGLLGFTPLPPAFFLFLTLVTGSYLVCVEVVKRYLMAR